MSPKPWLGTIVKVFMLPAEKCTSIQLIVATYFSLSEVVQITSDEVLKTHCDSHPLCVVAFLPHILDCQSKCRNEYISMLTKLGDKFKKQNWGWLWAEGTAHPELEQSLDVGGFGYPAMTVVSVKKMKYSSLTGSFGHDGIHEVIINSFLVNLDVNETGLRPVSRTL